MANVPNTQAGAAKAPAIPNMDVTPTPPASGREIANSVRNTVRQARDAAKTAARDAKQQAANAPKIAQGGDAAPTAITTVPPYNRDDVPSGVVDIVTALCVTFAIVVVGFPLSRAFGRRIDRSKSPGAVAGPDLTPQIRQLQDSVDAMAIELERISEGQRFTAKLLADRSPNSLKQ